MLARPHLGASYLDMGEDSIVEIGLLEDAGACFQTVVRPPTFGDDGAAVHGIPNAELAKGIDFVEAFSRMASFVEGLLDMSVDATGVHIVEVRPAALIVAHNGKRSQKGPKRVFSCVWTNNI